MIDDPVAQSGEFWAALPGDHPWKVATGEGRKPGPEVITITQPVIRTPTFRSDLIFTFTFHRKGRGE